MSFDYSAVAFGLTQRIITIVVQSLDFVAVEALVSDLQKSTEGTERRQLLDGVTDCLSCEKYSLCALTETVQPVRSSQGLRPQLSH
jgi:hypothetical protein